MSLRPTSPLDAPATGYFRLAFTEACRSPEGWGHPSYRLLRDLNTLVTWWRATGLPRDNALACLTAIMEGVDSPPRCTEHRALLSGMLLEIAVGLYGEQGQARASA